MSAHSYWRINVSANNGDTSFLAIAEMEMRASVGGADQCTGGSASASASDGTSPPSNAFDNDATTRWSTPSGTLTGWLAYQFASPVSVLEYTIQAHPTTPARSPKNWAIEYSDNGVDWVSLISIENQAGWTGGEIRTFAISSSTARLTQLAIEALNRPDADPLLSQVAVEVLILNVPDAADTAQPMVIICT